MIEVFVAILIVLAIDPIFEGDVGRMKGNLLMLARGAMFVLCFWAFTIAIARLV